MWKEYNPNPNKLRVGDCVIRAISKVLNQPWEKTYIDLCAYGLMYCDIPSANHVWGAYLRSKGFDRHIIPSSCPDCYTVRDFAEENPQGEYVCAISGHVVAVVDGNYYDTFDSGDMAPIYYWNKES